MKMTPNEAKKLLQKLQSDKNILLQSIDKLATYDAAVTENAAELKPEFDLGVTIAQIQEIDGKIIALKYALNLFNSVTILGPCGYSVSEALIRLPILNGELRKWENLATALPKTRITSLRSSEIEYRYVNYSLEYVKNIFEQVRDEIATIQEWIDMIGATKTFEVEI